MKNLPILIVLLMILLNLSNSKDYFGYNIYNFIMALLFLSGMIIAIKYFDRKRFLVVLIAVLFSIGLYFISI